MEKQAKNKTRELLLQHYQTYQKLQIQDIFKFLYQSSFGCEHLVASLDAVAEYITKEYASMCHQDKPMVEPLDGDYCRVSLSYLDKGLSISSFARLFFYSAKKEANGTTNLIHKLQVACELVDERLLPFEKSDFEAAKKEWEEKGYPALHHSSVFRESYHPSYRVIAKEYIPFLSLFANIDQHCANNSLRLAIEGGSASGKTTLGNLLTKLYDCTLFHMDDFFLRPEQRTPERYAEPGGNIDRERFLEEVLVPLSHDDIIRYRKFDCSTMNLGEMIQVTPKKIVIIEGAYSMHPVFAPYYNFSVFLDIEPNLQRERIAKRNSPALAKRFYNEWIPMEQKYFSEWNIQEQCIMTISITKS